MSTVSGAAQISVESSHKMQHNVANIAETRFRSINWDITQNVSMHRDRIFLQIILIIVISDRYVKETGNECSLSPFRMQNIKFDYDIFIVDYLINLVNIHLKFSEYTFTI